MDGRMWRVRGGGVKLTVRNFIKFLVVVVSVFYNIIIYDILYHNI